MVLDVKKHPSPDDARRVTSSYGLTASADSTATKSTTVSIDNDHIGQHPDLSKMCVMDCDTLKRVVPNSQAIPIDNDCFKGHFFLMVRTPDTYASPKKSSTQTELGETPARISQYLKPKKRHFEFQFQVKLRKVPTGPLFLGCELEHPIEMGRFTKGLSSVLLAMIGRINSGFHYSWGVDASLFENDTATTSSSATPKRRMGNILRKSKSSPPSLQSSSHNNTSGHKATADDITEGRYEKTHLSFPVEASMDRIVITKPGEKPPTLGYELHESDASVKRRRKMGAGSIDWNLEDTYTMCLWSAYVDWIKWKCVNVSGIRPFSLSSVTGKQPIYLSVYEVKGVSPAEYKKKKPPHLRKNLATFTRLEFSH